MSLLFLWMLGDGAAILELAEQRLLRPQALELRMRISYVSIDWPARVCFTK